MMFTGELFDELSMHYMTMFIRLPVCCCCLLRACKTKPRPSLCSQQVLSNDQSKQYNAMNLPQCVTPASGHIPGACLECSPDASLLPFNFYRPENIQQF
jgi:hypothetical protein